MNVDSKFHAQRRPPAKWLRWLARVSVTALAALFAVGCRSPQSIPPGEDPASRHTSRTMREESSSRNDPINEDVQFRILTFNVNWANSRPDLIAQILIESGADIVCLQETTPAMEEPLRSALRSVYSFAEFRLSPNRFGGGLAFFSRIPAREVAYLPSETGWFDGWIMAFETAAGPVQVLNVHLRPPVSDSGSWISGYLSTRDDRVREMEQFYAGREPDLPLLVAGDFNDGDDSAVIDWLKQKGFANALPAFDPHTPTWRWQTSLGTLHRRMDHFVYSPELRCCSAKVLKTGNSDHFPVSAGFRLRTLPPR